VRANAAELFRQEQNPRIGVDDFELVIRVFQIGPVADDAVVAEQDRVTNMPLPQSSRAIARGLQHLRDAMQRFLDMLSGMDPKL
jgi:hypothetical protein